MSEPSRSRPLLIALLVLLGLRLWLGTLPGYPPDLGLYKRWAVWAGVNGIHTLYDEGSSYDYPPLYGYMLAPVGWWVGASNPAYARLVIETPKERAWRVPYSGLFSLLVKLPPLVFDGLLAVLLGAVVHRQKLWTQLPDWGGYGPALLYLVSPAVLFLSGYWGQTDAIVSFFVVLGFVCVLQQRPELGWVAAALGVLMKPLAAPYLPLLGVLTLMRSGIKRSATAGAAALATVALSLVPFVMAGRGDQVVARLFTDLDAMAYTSVNAHNLWWLVGAWQPANAPTPIGLAPRDIGLVLFGVVYLGLLAWVFVVERRRSGSADPAGARDDSHWFVAAAGVAYAFFALSTHMHEQHLFGALPFLVLLAGRSRGWLGLFVVVSLSVLINMANHDLFVSDRLLSRFGGYTQVHVPVFAWFRELGGGITRLPYMSGLEVFLAQANAIGVLGGLVALLWLGWRETPRSDGPA